MAKKRRTAQIGLAAALLVMLGCLSILFIQDNNATAQEVQHKSPAPQSGTNAENTAVSAATPKL